MSHANPDIRIDAALAYEALMVPALFRQWATRVADAAAIRANQRVLDVACGTGVLTREAASRIKPAGSATGLDPDAGMLEVARRIAPDLEWKQGVAESIPFQDESFDVVVSQFGLMFFSDRRRALAEILRVLAKGGALTFAVWDSLDNIPAYADEVALVQEVAGQKAADALRFPFALGNRHALMALFSDAGVADVQCATVPGTAEFPDIRVMIEADLRGWLPLMGVILSEEQVADILRKAVEKLSPYATTKGTVSFDCSAHIITGRKP